MFHILQYWWSKYVGHVEDDEHKKIEVSIYNARKQYNTKEINV